MDQFEASNYLPDMTKEEMEMAELELSNFKESGDLTGMSELHQNHNFATLFVLDSGYGFHIGNSFKVTV